MRTVLNIFLLVSVSFISGTAVTYFFFVEYSRIRQDSEPAVKAVAGKTSVGANNAPILPPKVPGTVMEPDPYAQTPMVSEPRKMPVPQAEEAGEIIDLLRTQFIDASALISQQLSPETLDDLFAKYGDKAKLGESAVMTGDPKVKTILQTLPQNAVYWRPVDFSQRELDAFLKQWETLKAGNPKGLIIDVRNFRDGNNLQGAAAVAGLLVSPQDVLFTVEGLNFPQQVFRSQRQPLDLKQNFPIIVLVNNGTRGAAEALAFVLKQRGAALTIGRKTAGEGGLFTETRLRSGRFIRLATARISGFDGTSLLGSPLSPDITVDVSAQADNDAYYGAHRYGIQNVAAVKGPDRSVLKEREEMDLPLDNSLVDNKTPHDVILNAANDVLTGINLSRGK
jgi:hypothetical protein